MKINYKNTALGLLDDPNNFNFGFPNPDITPQMSKGELKTFGYSIIKAAPALKELCGNNVQFVSKSFFEAFAKGASKLTDVILNEEIEDGGTVIMGGHSGGYTHWHTYYYYVRTYFNESKEWQYEILFMDFSIHKNAQFHALDVYTSYTEEGSKDYIWNGYKDTGRDIMWWHTFWLSFVFFKKYCEIETKVIPATKKEKNVGVKYLNATQRNITVIDSTWFTTLVKSDGFKVRGHFRFQPYGPGNSLRKLIWIQDFEKDGYMRTAKALTQNNNSNGS
jgi:hypothetical protein